MKDTRIANEWKDMGRVLRAFFKHCILARSQTFKKTTFRTEMRELPVRRFIAKNMVSLVLIFEHYRCGTVVVLGKRDSHIGASMLR